MKVYLLNDITSGHKFIFSTIKKAYAFAVELNKKRVKEDGMWMNYGDDFYIEEITCNLDFDEWWKGAIK